MNTVVNSFMFILMVRKQERTANEIYIYQFNIKKTIKYGNKQPTVSQQLETVHNS